MYVIEVWAIDGFQSRDKTAMLVHKTIANHGSCFALKYSQIPKKLFSLLFCAPTNRETLDSNDQNQVADQRFSLKQLFAGGAQSRGLRKPGCGHCYLRFFVPTWLL